ncbi:hypothetical protein [Methanocella arvoryzae]|uniref:Uncharacterized protein n=1 Tax=Methanocella arvoryzae (strain DSM 22066 / NBRC 105507 / MRE50) TaxID=351160 RepID=Q0W1L0_METAR|nr:hypothetical protein [Methanocella arvoryzae]CAJ37733.1 hypothetical protein RCIX2689 [Methanocella arvoryzae MRE50]
MVTRKPAEPGLKQKITRPITSKLTEDTRSLSPFRTASDLMKEEKSCSENERRLQRWAELMIRDRKLAPGWKEDRDAMATVRWISDRNAAMPEAVKPKKSKARSGED